mgnify:CR=1 FL=1
MRHATNSFVQKRLRFRVLGLQETMILFFYLIAFVTNVVHGYDRIHGLEYAALVAETSIVLFWNGVNYV